MSCPSGSFSGCWQSASRKGLPSLSSLAAEGPHRLDKSNARKLAREVTAVEAVLNEPQLPAIIEIALWCAHATATAWLTIAGPQAQA